MNEPPLKCLSTGSRFFIASSKYKNGDSATYTNASLRNRGGDCIVDLAGNNTDDPVFCETIVESAGYYDWFSMAELVKRVLRSLPEKVIWGPYPVITRCHAGRSRSVFMAAVLSILLDGVTPGVLPGRISPELKGMIPGVVTLLVGYMVNNRYYELKNNATLIQIQSNTRNTFFD